LMRQLGQLKAQLAAMLQPKDLIRAAIAASSLPVIVRPCGMQDGQTYVDGGIRTLAPIQAAIDAGASNVYVVAASSTKFDRKSISDITTGTALPLLSTLRSRAGVPALKPTPFLTISFGAVAVMLVRCGVDGLIYV
jgi:predicted acylesterase/phospholipase RssA